MPVDQDTVTLMEQMIQRVVGNDREEKDDQGRGRVRKKRLSPIPKTLQLKIHSRRVWGELFLELPDGYDLADLADDLGDLVDECDAIHESKGGDSRKSYSRGKRYED